MHCVLISKSTSSYYNNLEVLLIFCLNHQTPLQTCETFKRYIGTIIKLRNDTKLWLRTIVNILNFVNSWEKMVERELVFTVYRSFQLHKLLYYIVLYCIVLYRCTVVELCIWISYANRLHGVMVTFAVLLFPNIFALRDWKRDTQYVCGTENLTQTCGPCSAHRYYEGIYGYVYYIVFACPSQVIIRTWCVRVGSQIIFQSTQYDICPCIFCFK